MRVYGLWGVPHSEGATWLQLTAVQESPKCLSPGTITYRVIRRLALAISSILTSIVCAFHNSSVPGCQEMPAQPRSSPGTLGDFPTIQISECCTLPLPGNSSSCYSHGAPSHPARCTCGMAISIAMGCQGQQTRLSQAPKPWRKP